MYVISNIFKMYTFHQSIFVLLVILYPKLLSEEIIDIIRGSCVIVASLIINFYLYFGYNEVIKVYMKILYFIPKDILNILCPIIDFIVHFFVIFLVGLPKNPLSILYAAIILILWFETNKTNIQQIYPVNFTKDMYDYIEYTLFPILIVFLILMTYIFSYK